MFKTYLDLLHNVQYNLIVAFKKLLIALFQMCFHFKFNQLFSSTVHIYFQNKSKVREKKDIP